jgi:phosphocarrier protein
MFVTREVIVRCESGLHNKQVTYFVQKANEFQCGIWLESENRRMNAKSLLGIMSMGIITGAVVTLSADGSDAQEAVNALEAMLQRDVY